MRTTRKTGILISALGLASVVLVAGAAWGCTAFTTLSAPQTSPAKGPLSLKGTGLPSAVELRWNDVKGPVLASAQTDAGSFKLEATVPDVSPGIYYVVAVEPETGQAVTRTVLEVTPPPGSEAVAAPVTALGSEQAGRRLVYRAAGNQDGMATGMKLLVFGSIALLFSFGTAAVVSTRRATVRRHSAPLHRGDASDVSPV